MAKQENHLLSCLNAGSSHWQYHHNSAEYGSKQPHYQVNRIQVNQNTGDRWILTLGIIGTIGFLVMLAVKTIFI